MNCVKNQIKINFFKVLQNSNQVDINSYFLPLQIPVSIACSSLPPKPVFLFYRWPSDGRSYKALQALLVFIASCLSAAFHKL
jgi:hypothetical protein